MKKTLSIVKFCFIALGLHCALSPPTRAEADELCGEDSECIGFEDICLEWENVVDPPTGLTLPICVESDSEPICTQPSPCEIGDPDPCGRCGGDPDYGKSCSDSGSGS
jgi:hypothetical protein